MNCGAEALRDTRWVGARARWMSTGEPDGSRGVLEAAIGQALGRTWCYGDAFPTFERLTHTSFCAECDAKNRERRQRQRDGREAVPGCRIVRDPAWTVPAYREVVEVFALELRNARKRSGLSQAAVARRLGRRQTFLSKLEAGERRLSVVDVIEIAAVMDLDVAEFTSLLRSVWWQSVYRHVQPVFEVKSTTSDGDGEAVDEPQAPTQNGAPAVDERPDPMAGQLKLWG